MNDTEKKVVEGSVQPKPPAFEKGTKNAFGGGNPNGLYVPMSDEEQEVLHRLAASGDFEMVVHGWGVLHQPHIVVGDHRLGITFNLQFSTPKPIPITYLDLELRTHAGLTLTRQKMPITYDGKPVMVGNDVLTFKWDIAIKHMSPELVKMYKPGALGLTSRLQDRDTKDFTSFGNMRLDEAKKRMIRQLEAGHRAAKQWDAQRLAKAVEQSVVEKNRRQ